MYGLKVEENTPFGKDKGLVLPDEERQCEMYLAGVERLEKYGFLQYEISNFAKEGYRSRHNLKYWKREPYLGFGCAAHSCFDKARFFAPSDLKTFCSQQDFSLQSGFYDLSLLEDEDEKSERVMLSLRLSDGMPTEELYALCDAQQGSGAKKYLDQLLDQGYANDHDDFYRLTPLGMLVSNSILSQLLLYMES